MFECTHNVVESAAVVLADHFRVLKSSFARPPQHVGRMFRMVKCGDVLPNERKSTRDLRHAACSCHAEETDTGVRIVFTLQARQNAGPTCSCVRLNGHIPNVCFPTRIQST